MKCVHFPLLLLLPALAGLSGCGGSEKTDARGGGAPAVTVTTTTVQPTAWRDAIEALGTVQANESLVLTAKVTETVDAVNFEDGDLAQAGQVLVDLSGRAEVAQLEEERAAWNEAQQQLVRLEELVKQGTIPRSQVDSQLATRDAAKARMDTIRARLSDRVITAPFDGVLGFRRVSPGTLVTPGTPIATLDDIRTVKLDFPVPESFLSDVRPGLEISARSAAWPEREFDGTVRAVDSRVDPVTRAVMVRAELPNPASLLRPGMLMAVQLLKPQRETLTVPEIAVVQVGTRSFVYRVGGEDAVEQAEVRTGSRRAGTVEILEGLSPGDRIVVDGTGKLRPGARIVEAPARDGAGAAVANQQE